MHIELINTGTELLLGNTQNTHLAWIGRELFPLGLRIAKQCTVPDGDAIREALVDALKVSHVVIITGGLGPTSDDLTREITAEAIGADLIEDEAAMRSLEEFFAKRKKVMVESNRKQALCPVGADILPNKNGTAPGIYVPPRLGNGTAIFLLPGPPRELYPMFQDEIIPRLRALAGIDEAQKMQELKFIGIGESDLHDLVDAQLASIPGLELGYCARLGEVDVRLIGKDAAIQAGKNVLLEKISAHLVSENGDALEKVVVNRLAEKSWQLALAESCTGGLICSRITDVAGASNVFTHGFIVYANEAKEEMIGVPRALIENHGAVSEEVAIAMAQGALEKSGADIAAAVTGIAGPSGGTAEKPVGTAWICVAKKSGEIITEKVLHPRDRISFKRAVSQAVLFKILQAIK